MDSFTKKSFTSPRSLTYTYYDSAPTKPAPAPASTPTILLLHGFPDTAHLWKKVVPHLIHRLPNRIIIPDLLGSGTSSKPTNPRLYNSHALSADLAALLAAASVTQNVVAIGHDWGSYAAQRLWLWQPQLVCGLGLLNVGYMAPATAPFDVAALNDATEQATGLPRFAYWELFVAEDGARVLDGHLESFWGVLHGERENWMREMFCTRGAMRAFLERDGRVGALREYARPGQGWKEEWFKEVEEGGGGLDGALGPYRAMVEGHQYEVERTLPPERVKVTVPAFFLGCEQDEVCTMDLVEENRKAGLLPDLTVKVIDSGHWCTMEKPDEVGEALYDWLVEKF